MSSWNPNADWIQTKVGIGGKYNADELNSKYRLKNGYTPKNKATVYKHILAMHVPDMIGEATNIKQFSCQGG